MNISRLNVESFRQQHLGRNTFPAMLNSLSTGADEAGMVRDRLSHSGKIDRLTFPDLQLVIVTICAWLTEELIHMYTDDRVVRWHGRGFHIFHKLEEVITNVSSACYRDPAVVFICVTCIVSRASSFSADTFSIDRIMSICEFHRVTFAAFRMSVQALMVSNEAWFFLN